MSQVPQSNLTPTVDRPANGSAAADPLGRLHKMSTTAGVTNLDYVAVNQTAIAAVLLGLLSAVSFFGFLLLLIPIVAVVFAVVALRQIGQSNGTQTGRGLALLGLALAVVLGGWAIGQEVLAAARVRGDETAIANTISQVGNLVREGKHKEAYELFDPEFQKKVPLTLFQTRWTQILGSSELGKFELFEWNGVTPAFESMEGRKAAATKVRTKFEKGSEDRFDLVLREDAGRWLIYQLRGFFPESLPSPPPGGGRPSGPSNDVFNF